MDFIPSLEGIKDTAQAVSWSWYGASALCIGAGVLLIIFLKQFTTGVFCITVGVALGFVGTLYTQRDLARAEAKQQQARADALDKKIDEIRVAMEKAEAAVKAKEKRDAAIKKRLEKELASERAELERLRNAKPVDPSGREIQTTACSASGTNAVPGELVPLADYKSLQERAFKDALRLTKAQDFITESCGAVPG